MSFSIRKAKIKYFLLQPTVIRASAFSLLVVGAGKTYMQHANSGRWSFDKALGTCLCWTFDHICFKFPLEELGGRDYQSVCVLNESKITSSSESQPCSNGSPLSTFLPLLPQVHRIANLISTNLFQLQTKIIITITISSMNQTSNTLTCN